MGMRPEEHPALQLLSELLSVPGPSGREELVAEIVRKRLIGLDCEHETDPSGNIIVRLEGKDSSKGRVLFAAHTDEIAVVVTQINDDGTLQVERSGGLYPAKAGEGPMTVVGDNGTITALLSMGSMHRKDAAELKLSWSDCKLITGLNREQLMEKGIRPGSTAVPTCERRGPIVFGDPGDPLVMAWTFDDRLGVAMLLLLLERVRKDSLIPNRPTTIAFTVHEEGGCHGATALAGTEEPEIFIAIDGCPIPPGSPIVMDERPCTWSKDSIAHYDQRLVRAIIEAGNSIGIEVQTAVYDGAASDASRVYSVGGAKRIALLGHVRENSHGFEVIKFNALDNVLNLITEVFLRID